MILKQKQFCALGGKKTTPKPRMFQFDSYVLRVAILNSELGKLNLAARFDKMLVEQ